MRLVRRIEPSRSRENWGAAARLFQGRPGEQVTLGDKSDKELVRLCRRGHERAARELVTRFQGPVISLIYRMVRDRELAEDLSQEAFVRTFNNLDRYDPSYRFSSWLFKIAHNLTIDHLRRREVETISMHGAPDATTAERQDATSITPVWEGERADERVEALELAGELEQAIARLRPEYRSAILLRHVEDRSYEEIADIMGVPLGTVKTFIFRARRELRDSLRPPVSQERVE